MQSETSHISDEELLLAADGELDGRRVAEIHAHMAGCWQCRARMVEIDASIAGFMRAHRGALDAQLPPVAGPRALLRVRLAEFAGKSPAGSFRRGLGRLFPSFTGLASPRPVAVLWCMALLVVAVSGIYLSQRSGSPVADILDSAPERGAKPDPGLTPGATRAVAISDVCSMAHEAVVGEVSLPLRQQVLREYGIENARPNDYEIDYLIAPGLGGAEDIHNLWPQPYSSQTWNAYTKDSLEEHLHQLVCAGKLDLTIAQHDIATDWIAAYKKYFHTNRPLPVSSPRVTPALAGGSA